jgi:hypothetical protein
MRKRLANRRGGLNVDFWTSGTKFTALLGYDEQHTLREVFLRAGKVGSDVNISMLEAAIAVSFALQWGCLAEDMRAAMPRRSDGSPEGPIGTLLDLIAEGDLQELTQELLR